MKKVIVLVCWIILVSSSVAYLTGRVVFRHLISDDTGDWFLWSGSVSLILILILSIRGIRPEAKSVVNSVLVVLIALAAAFGCWGLFSSTGKNKYEEMSALVPYYSLLLSAFLLAISIIANLLWRLKRNRNPTKR